MKGIRHFYFIAGLFFVIIGFISKISYRPFVYLNDFFDFGLANSLSSLLYVVGFSLLLLVNKQFSAFYTISIVVVGSILFECYQYIGTRKFDISDIVYSIVGGILAIIIHNGLQKAKRSKGYS